MTILLRDIAPPHEPRDDAKLSSLVTAYNDGADVPPVVVIDWTDSEYDGRRPSALSGSHRLAALLEVYDGDQPANRFDEIETVDGGELVDALVAIRDAEGDRSDLAAAALADLDSLSDPFAGTDFGALVSALLSLGVLPEAAAAALADQAG